MLTRQAILQIHHYCSIMTSEQDVSVIDPCSAICVARKRKVKASHGGWTSAPSDASHYHHIYSVESLLLKRDMYSSTYKLKRIKWGLVWVYLTSYMFYISFLILCCMGRCSENWYVYIGQAWIRKFEHAVSVAIYSANSFMVVTLSGLFCFGWIALSVAAMICGTQWEQ